ncbi:NAD(P)-binding protein, partial [Peniophora sp. CONT]
GALGYLGGATLQLLMHKPDLAITALVRNKDKAVKLEQLGVKTVLGSLDDTDLLEAEGTKADVVVQGAAYDHLDGVEALLKGAKTHFEQTGKQPIFIQTSGTGGFAKLDAMGEYTSDRVLSDTDPDLFNFKNTLAHGVVNDALIAADGEGYVRAYIVYPSIIYGVLKGPLVDAGIAHAYSIAIILAVKLSIQRGQGAMVGKGLNRWPAAHIDDTAELYKLIFERALANEAPHGSEGIYAVENGEFSFGDAAKRYTAVLHAHGKSAKAEPEVFAATEFEKIPLLYILGTDVRITADRARKLGWNPVHGIEEFYESVQEDTEAVLAGTA